MVSLLQPGYLWIKSMQLIFCKDKAFFENNDVFFVYDNWYDMIRYIKIYYLLSDLFFNVKYYIASVLSI